MFSPVVIGLVVFAVVLAGAFAGAMVKRRVPQHHPTEETKGLVSVSMALVATISALVLGLLLSKRQQLVQRSSGTSDHALRGNPPTGSTSPSIRSGDEIGPSKAQ